MNNTVHIVYASASGNTRAVAEYIHGMLQSSDIDCSIIRVEKFTPTDFSSSKYQIFALSTWEHGRMSPYFDTFYKSLTMNLADKSAAFVGTGDLRYEPILFCGGMTTLREKYLKMGGNEITSSLKINQDPYSQLDTLVKRWTEKFIAEFSKLPN